MTEDRSSLTDADYQRLLAFRTGLRRFLRWSEEQAVSAGLTPSQHQLMLVIRGHDDPRGPTIKDVAELLMLRHNSAVELIDRAEAHGLVNRSVDPEDHRVTRLALTTGGRRRLELLSSVHLEELQRLAPRMRPIWDGLETPAI